MQKLFAILVSLCLGVSQCLATSITLTGAGVKASGGGPTIFDLGNKTQFLNQQTIVLTAAHAASSGNLVVVFVFDGNTSITGATVTDSKSNTYTLAKAAGTGGGNAPFAQVFYSFITSALTVSDTITYTTAAGFTTQTMDIAAAATSGYSAIDSAVTNSATNGFASTFTVSGAGTAGFSNEINFGFVFANSTPTVTAAGWSTNPPSSPNASFLASWQVNSGTSALTYSGTLSASQWATSIIVGFH